MQKALVNILSAVFILTAYSYPLLNNSFADEAGDAFKEQEKYLEPIKKENPRLYEFEKRLLEIKEEIQEIIKKYTANKMSREKAREALAPLLKEMISIQQNPDYILEQQLFSILGQSGLSE